ncbi:MAG TPA: sigma-54-dependent Fis family transcriptional regulator, partial [Massilia timonae]|nr:sigma-54-dependent Fis family transcriptional regulator [Massilia timonae]
MSAPRILVLDDEADLRELLEITLLKMGLDVDCAATLREARRLVDDNAYNLVLTDMRLPDGL